MCVKIILDFYCAWWLRFVWSVYELESSLCDICVEFIILLITNLPFLFLIDVTLFIVISETTTYNLNKNG